MKNLDIQPSDRLEAKLAELRIDNAVDHLAVVAHTRHPVCWGSRDALDTLPPNLLESVPSD